MRPTLLLLVLLAVGSPALAQPPTEDIDRGSFLIYLRDQAIGAETFGVEGRADSINAGAHSYLKRRTQAGEELLEKAMVLSASRADFALRFYQSNETVRGKTIIVGVIAGEEDTALTIFREERQGAGVATRLAAPPGRFYVLDSGLYSLFNIICLNLHGKTFATRPIPLITLSAARDTLIEAEVADLGTETIRWGSRPVQARKLQLKDRGTVFQVWLSPAGKMLRLVHEPSGLRVERDAAPVKRVGAGTPKPGG